MRKKSALRKVPKKEEGPIPARGKEKARGRQLLWISGPLLLISLVGIIAYSNSFHCSFHFDDVPYIAENTALRNLADVKSWWGLVPSRPIGTLSFALNYHFNGYDVWGYHVVNLTIHIVNALLVWWLVMLTMATPVMRAQPVSRHKELIALFTALLFVSHPLATQSVTYIVQRLASLATLFYLLSLALYVKGRLKEESGGRPVFFFYAGSIISASLGMLTKEIVFTLPFAIVLYEFSFIKTEKWKIDPGDRRIQFPIIILALFTAFFFLNFSFAIFNPIPPLLYQGYDYPITAWEYLLTQFSVILTYIRLFFLPLNQNLDYDYPVSRSLFEIHTLVGLLSIAGILVLGVFLFRRYRLISFGIFWFFLTLSVESSIIPISQNVIFEHRTYLPSFGFFLSLAGAFFYFLYDRYKYVVMGVIALMILTGTVLTYERNRVWKNEYTLWSDGLIKSPNKPRPLTAFGKALADAGNASEALVYYNKAIELNPRFYHAYYNRGNVKNKLGDYKGAIADYEEGLRIEPDFADGHYNLGNAFARQGRMEEAEAQLREAVRIRPRSAEYHNNLGYVLALKGKEEEAISHFREAISLNPGIADVHNNLGSALLHQRRVAEAIDSYRQALRIKPDFQQAKDNLQRALAASGKQ